MQNLCSTFHVNNLLFVQSFYRQCHHTIEHLHAEVVVVILLEYGRRIDDMRWELAVIAVNMVTVAQLSATACNGSVLGVSCNTFDEGFDALRREFQCIFLVSKY